MTMTVHQACGCGSGEDTRSQTIMRVALMGLVLCILAAWPSHAEGLRLLSVAIRGSVSETTVLGDDAPEKFEALDAPLRGRLYSAGLRSPP